MQDSMTQAAPVTWCPKESLGYRLKRCLHAWSRQFDNALKPLGLTHLQFVTLGAIEDISALGEIPSQVRVADWMHQDVMMMSKIIRLLEDRGYLDRFPHPEDPRANALSITVSGRTQLQDGKPRVIAAHRNFFGRLSDTEQQLLTATLDKLLVDE
jgi:MarR family transcriptional regulator, organic hydroperoxide resistance regulator